jgi:8-oxo-dGTP diphosphatase
MKKLQIAVGIIRNENNEIFTLEDEPLATVVQNMRKSEMGETPEQAVVRELQEEVGITPQHFSLFEKLEYEFPDRHITLWFWLVERWEGEPWGKEGQPGEWMSLVGLNADDFPPANEPVIAKLKRL